MSAPNPVPLTERVLMRRGELPYVRLGGMRLIARKALDELADPTYPAVVRPLKHKTR